MKKTLSLKDFIKESLIDINAGVIDAVEAGVTVVYKEYKDGTYPSSQTISFDLSVSIEEENNEQKDKSGGLAISVVSGKIGKKSDKKQFENTVNRIQFSIEAFLGMEKPETEDE